MDDNDKTVTASGGGGRRKGGFEESSRITKSKRCDSPWCEPITPLFSEIVVRLLEAKKHACGRSIIHGGEDRQKVLRKSKTGY